MFKNKTLMLLKLIKTEYLWHPIDISVLLMYFYLIQSYKKRTVTNNTAENVKTGMLFTKTIYRSKFFLIVYLEFEININKFYSM